VYIIQNLKDFVKRSKDVAFVAKLATLRPFVARIYWFDSRSMLSI